MQEKHWANFLVKQWFPQQKMVQITDHFEQSKTELVWGGVQSYEDAMKKTESNDSFLSSKVAYW